MWPNPLETADLVTFIKKILNGKLQFLCSERCFWNPVKYLRCGFLQNSERLKPVNGFWKTLHHRYLTGPNYALVKYFVGNKAKGKNSKRVLQENKARQIFRKTNISYRLIRKRTCAYQGVRNVHFPENVACFVFL